MLALLLTSLQGYQIISFDVVNKFQALLQISSPRLDFPPKQVKSLYLFAPMDHFSSVPPLWFLLTCAQTISSRYECSNKASIHT